MARLKITVELADDIAPLGYSHAVADIHPRDRKAGSLAGRSDVPVGVGSSAGTVIDGLAASEYLVQLRFPSGQRETRMVSVEDGQDNTLAFAIGPEPSRRAVPKREAGQRDPSADPAPVREEIAVSEDPAIDLQQIRGIGPAVAKALVERGVDSVWKVARMSRREMGWLGQSAKSVNGTIRRFDIAKGAAGVILDEGLDTGGFLTNFTSGTDGVATGPSDDFVAFGPSDAIVPSTDYEPVEADSGSDRPVEPAVDAVREASLHPFELALGDDGSSIWSWIENVVKASLPPQEIGHPGPAIALVDGMRWQSRDGYSTIAIPTGFAAPQEADEASRIYGVIDDGYAAWLAPLPLPWRRSDDHELCEVAVVADRRNPMASAVSIVPRDPLAAGLIEFLQSGDMLASVALIEQARTRLFEKLNNPLAAAAGALVLVQFRRWAPHLLEQKAEFAADERWQQWISNLREWNPRLPDGFILHAWLDLLQEETDDTIVRERLLAANARGVPVYSGCFTLLVDGLRALQARADERDPAIDAALRQLDIASLRIDLRQAFTTIRLSPSAP